MGAVIGAILILAGSVLIGAGIIADGLRNQGNGFAGYVLGTGLGFLGFMLLVSGPLIRATKSADDRKPDPPN